MIEEKDLKQDIGKLQFDLLPVDALEELIKVYMMGANKYAPHSWEKGMKMSRIYAALLRHLFAWCGGENKDSESGLSHLTHVAWNALALLTYVKRGLTEFDDRPKPMYKVTPTKGAI